VKLLAAILITLALIPSLFSGDEKLANFVYDACTMPMVPIILFYLFSKIPSDQLVNRGIASSLVVIFSAKFFSYLSVMLSVELGFIVYIIAAATSYSTLAMVCLWKDEKSDIIDSNGTYFVFKRPRNFFDFIITLFRAPVTSFSIVQNDRWYRFSRRHSGLYSENVGHADISDYIFKRVPDIERDDLEDLVGEKWTIKGNNCITAFKHVLLVVGVELKRFDFIPAVFAYRFFKNK
jgi:hypothetical protein